MTILITAPSLDPAINVNGVSTVVQTIIEHNIGHSYFHYLLGRPDKKQSAFISLFQLMKQLAAFPFFLKKNRIELVHQNLPFNSRGVLREYIINCWCKFFRIPVLLHVHGGEFLMNGAPTKFYKYLSVRLLNNSKTVVVLSELESESINSHFNCKDSRILYNSIDTTQYEHLNKEISQKPTIIFLGRIHESKGVEDIVDFFKLLKPNLDFRFILCGIGPLQEYFIKECTTLLGADFEYLGIVSGAEKLAAFCKSDYFILPSRYGEGLPMALLESMAAGLVPIVTDDASMKYVVHHKMNGIRVEKYNPQDIFDKFYGFVSDEGGYESLSDNAKITIKEQFDIKKYITNLNELYKTVINYE